MSQTYIPFLKWGQYKSTSEKTPDSLHIEVLDSETFETEYSRNARVKVDDQEMIMPLYNFESQNKQLLKAWLKYKQEGKLPPDAKFTILTWLGKSKKNKDRNIRRFRFKF
jgi:hypothetical protein